MERFVVSSSNNSNDRYGNNHTHISGENNLLSKLRERHVQSSNVTGKRKIGDILGNLEGKENHCETFSPVETRKEVIKSEWEARDSSAMSSFDLHCLQKQSQLKARNYVGWKMDREGNKVYATFRNGEKVQVSGQEAFRLALADGKIVKKPKKDEIQEYKEEEEPQKKELIKAKTKEASTLTSYFRKSS